MAADPSYINLMFNICEKRNLGLKYMYDKSDFSRSHLIEIGSKWNSALRRNTYI